MLRGNIYKNLGTNNRNENEVREVTRDVAEEIVQRHRNEIYREVFQELKQELKQKKVDSFNKLVTASLIAISACQESEEALDGEDNGVFTAALKKIWFGTDEQIGDFQDSHFAFFKAVEQTTADAANQLGKNQNPDFFPHPSVNPLVRFPKLDIHKLEAFVNSNPFKIT